MGLFSGSKKSDGLSRAQRRAEAKAIKAKAKLEAKLEAKGIKKASKDRLKAEHKIRKKDLKAQNKSAKKNAKAQAKIADAEAKAIAAKAKADADAKPFSQANIKRYLTVAKLLSPILAPIVYRAAVAGRGQLTTLRAERAGVAPEVLQQYSGHGATLSARIETTRASLDKVAANDQSGDSSKFVSAMTDRLDNLAVAVDAAESMPGTQRKNAHQAINEELGAIEGDILARLGVNS